MSKTSGMDTKQRFGSFLSNIKKKEWKKKIETKKQMPSKNLLHYLNKKLEDVVEYGYLSFHNLLLFLCHTKSFSELLDMGLVAEKDKADSFFVVYSGDFQLVKSYHQKYQSIDPDISFWFNNFCFIFIFIFCFLFFLFLFLFLFYFYFYFYFLFLTFLFLFYFYYLLIFLLIYFV